MPTTLHDNTYHIDDRDMAERDMDERVARQLPSSKWTRQPSNKSHQNYLNRRPMRQPNQFQLMKTTGTSTNEKIDEYICDQVKSTTYILGGIFFIYFSPGRSVLYYNFQQII